MPVQDRTNEFKSCVQSIRTRSVVPPAKQRLLSRRVSDGTQRSDFSIASSEIAKAISATAVKLNKLGQLARRKTLFDDRPVEISELTFIIKQDIAAINKQIASLQQLLKHPNGKAKGPVQKLLDEHHGNIVMMLQSKLASMSMSFKDVLEIRTQNMKESKDRTEQFMSSTSAAVNQPPPNSLLFGSRNTDPMGDGSSQSASEYKGKARARNTDNDILSLDLLEQGSNAQGPYAQMQLVAQQDDYIQQRSTAIESVEATIAELGQIFQQLAHMVAEQRETVQRIDADTLDIASNVEGAQRELLKYFSSMGSNRWLMLKVFGVLIVFFLVFILVS